MSLATFDKDTPRPEQAAEEKVVATHMSNISNMIAADVASSYSHASSNLSVMRKLRMDKSQFSSKVSSLQKQLN